MAMSAPRSSVFTFESTVHGSNVLRCLDEQRRRDVLCDVTVLCEGQSFRAHRSVLASCSQYFTHRTSCLSGHGAVITLPNEVTAAGFEPLLKFAYTSKLLFDKDTVLDIRNSASILGFRDLDEACFDFLLPKLLSSSKSSVPFPRTACCKKKYKRRVSEADCCLADLLLDEKEVKPVADSPSPQEVAPLCEKSVSGEMGSQNGTGTLTPTPVTEVAHGNFMQCPKYRKFQLACGKGACVRERSLGHIATVTKEDSDGASSKRESEERIPEDKTMERWKTERGTEDAADGMEVLMVQKDSKERAEREKESDVMKMEEEEEETEHASSGVRSSEGERSPGLILHHCPLRDLQEDKKKPCGTSMERENEPAVDNVREGTPPGGRDPGAGSSSETGSGQPQDNAPLDWLKLHVDLGSGTSASCPFLQDLDQGKCSWKGAGLSEGEGASSSLNSGEDGDSGTETEGDSEAYSRERARQVQLPFSVDWIVDLSRNDFQQLLKQQVLRREQLEFVYDMRRRSKNRLAAKRCRKRKLDCIHNLQCEIIKLKTEKEKLILEKSQLSQMKMKTRHTVSALCHKVCDEANLQPEQLQVLAKYTSPDCPLSSFLPHVDALLSQHGFPPQPLCPAGPQEALCSSSRDHVTGDAPL